MIGQIITQGIGSSGDLTLFLTVGLSIGAAPAPAAVTIPTQRLYDVPFEDRVLGIPLEDRVLETPFEDRVLEVRE